MSRQIEAMKPEGNEALMEITEESADASSLDDSDGSLDPPSSPISDDDDDRSSISEDSSVILVDTSYVTPAPSNESEIVATRGELSSASPTSHLNAKVAKLVRGSYWIGTITKEEKLSTSTCTSDFCCLWHVEYDNGQEEDWMDLGEVLRGLELWQNNQEKAAHRKQRSRSRTQPLSSKPPPHRQISNANPGTIRKSPRKRKDCDRYAPEERFCKDAGMGLATRGEVSSTAGDRKDDPAALSDKRPSKLDSQKKERTCTCTCTCSADLQQNFSFPYQNAQVAKMFDGTIHYGKITKFFHDASQISQDQDQWFWTVDFDDEDEEDWDLLELQSGIETFQSRPRKRKKQKRKTIKIANHRGKKTADQQPKYSDTDNGGLYYQVEKVVDRRTKTVRHGFQAVEYLVHWKNSWVEAERLGPDILVEAFRSFPNDENEGEGEGVPVTQEESSETSVDDATRVVTIPGNQCLSTIGTTSAVASRSENDDSADESDTALQDYDIDVVAGSNYELQGGIVETTVNGRTYRIGASYSATKGDFILTILKMTIRGDEHLAECIKYIPSRATFLGVSNTKQPSRELYYEFGTKEIVPLSALTRPYKREFAKSDWMLMYDYDPKKKGNRRNFCYYKNLGRIQPSKPGKPSVLELFAGAGGMSIGFKNAGLEVKWAVEKDTVAAATIKANFTRSEVYTETVQDFLQNAEKGESSVKASAYPTKEEVQHIHASPPCQGSSRANRVGGGEAIKNNDQTFQFVEAIRYFEPLTATLENVPGFLLDDNRHYLQKVVSDLLLMKYQVRLEVLNSSDYGDPQNRRRVFLFAAKVHMRLPSAPEVTHGKGGRLIPKRTVRDAIGWLEDHAIQNPSSTKMDTFHGETVHNLHGSDAKSQDDHILHANRPARTILGHPAAHYSGRCLTVRETACLQSFPSDYTFGGSITQQYKQVGNAVPVMMATHVARSVARVYGLP